MSTLLLGGLGAFTLLIFQQFLTCIGIPSFGALKWHSFLDIFNCVLGRKFSMYDLSSVFDDMLSLRNFYDLF